MSIEKQYSVNLKGVAQKTFNLGGGKMLTINHGAIIGEGHQLVKLFPSYVTLIGERVLLEEAPVASATLDEGEKVEQTPIIEGEKQEGEKQEGEKAPDVETPAEQPKEPAKRGPKPKVQE